MKQTAITATGLVLLLLALFLGHATAQFGVASFEVSDTSAILWTRVEGTPTVHAQVSLDATFGTLFMEQMDIPVNFEMDFTSHVLIQGLTANTIYFYRFLNQDRSLSSNVGKFKTLQGKGDMIAQENRTLVFNGIFQFYV